MKIDSEICYTIQINVKVIPDYHHIIEVDVIADSLMDAFAIARETVTYIYQYNDDCIISENLIAQKPIYKAK